MNIHQFWKEVLSQNASALPSYFHPDACIRWHCTGEQFTVKEFIRANCEYPGAWAGDIERIEQSGTLIITATHVYPADHSASFHVVSFISLQDDRIISMDEYWADDGPPPFWRQQMHIGSPSPDGPHRPSFLCSFR